MNRNNILLIIIGVIWLGISIAHMGGVVIARMFPRSVDNLRIEEMVNIANWSGVFSVAMIGWGIGWIIYNKWRR